MRLRPLPSLPVHRPSVQVAPDNLVPHIVDIVRYPPPHALPSPAAESILSDDMTPSYVYDPIRSNLEELVTPEPSLCSVSTNCQYRNLTRTHTSDYDSDPDVQMPTRLTAMRISQILKFGENGDSEFSGLLYYSPHSVAYQDELYPTVLHLFEARKFVDHRPDLAERIRLCERIEEVTAVSAELAEFMRRDWNNVVLGIVSAGFFVSCKFLADLLIGAEHGHVGA